MVLVLPPLCAGITTYSPLINWEINPESKVGVIGLGGLGHMGVKFSHALGAHTTMITSSEQKGVMMPDCLEQTMFYFHSMDALSKEAGSFDFLLNTIPVNHDLTPYLELLKTNGTMCVVGAVEPLESGQCSPAYIWPPQFGRFPHWRDLSETQEMLDFCGEKNILSEVEVIRMDEINDAYTRMQKNDVKYRFVLYLGSLN